RIGAVDRVPDLGEEDRVRHWRVVELLGEVILLHAEGAETAVGRFAGRNAGRDRPVIACDAVDCDGHHLVVFVDGDGDTGLRGGTGEECQAGNGNEEGTHFDVWPPGLTLQSRGSSSPAHTMPEMPRWFQRFG